MTWDGRSITGSSKSSETQFIYLMQMILHYGKNGVSRDQLEKNLFEDREVADPHHSMRSVIYNAKKKLKAVGLPDVNYMEQREGIFYWTDQVPIVIDTAEMDRYYQEALEATDPEEKLKLYLNACHCYTGEFLGTQTGMVWAVQEARRYRNLFCTCVEEAVALLQDAQDYFQMEQLGLYAAKINPLADWETVTMEALVALGRYEDARKLYDDTVELYMLEQGLRPSGRMLELLNKLGAQMRHHYAVLDDIQAKLSKDGDSMPGGYFCTYPVFQGIYQMVKRIMERGGQSVFLMLCTVVDGKGNPVGEGSMLDELSERLGSAIRQSVRRSDAINQYGKGQYLVLLINTTRENCEILQNRIRYHFMVGRQRIGIQYYVNSVICTPQQER